MNNRDFKERFGPLFEEGMKKTLTGYNWKLYTALRLTLTSIILVYLTSEPAL